MDVFEQLAQRKVIPLEILGIDISITNGVISLWLAAFFTFVFFFAASRQISLVPHKLQNAAEALVLFIRDEAALQIGRDSGKWLPFLVVLFTFILFNNLLGLAPGLSGATANINTTATLAVIVFVTVQVAGILKHGLFGYIKSFFPEGVPGFILVFLIPIELVSQLARPFSLALRLFANMFAGHAVMLLLLSLIFIFRSYLVLPFPIIGDTVILLFEIFVSFIQAFVFTYLSALYIATALEGH